MGRVVGFTQAGQLPFELFEHLGAMLTLAVRLLGVVAHHVAPAPLSVPDPDLLGLEGEPPRDSRKVIGSSQAAIADPCSGWW